jgi:hypothetical protein
LARIVPTPPIRAAGSRVTAATYEADITDPVTFIANLPQFYGYQTVAQSIASGPYTAVTLDTGVFDPDGCHSNVTNSTRFTPKFPGLYLVIGIATVAANASGVRGLRLALNGTTQIASSQQTPPTNASFWGQLTLAAIRMNGVTDYVEVQVAQTSGGALNTYVGSDGGCAMLCYWISS